MRTSSLSGLVIAIVVTLFLGACTVVAETPVVSNFDECVAAGNKVLRSYPARCVTSDGFTFTESVAGGTLNLLETPPANKKFCVDTCGNGICEMMVCMAEGCPCAENSTNCPKDCQ